MRRMAVRMSRSLEWRWCAARRATIASAGCPARSSARSETLDPPARKLDQILLERLPTKGVADRIGLGRATRAFRFDPVAPVPAEEARGQAMRGEGGVVEVTQNRLLIRLHHRPVMVGTAPARGFLGMALSADLLADIGGFGRISDSGRTGFGVLVRCLDRHPRQPCRKAIRKTLNRRDSGDRNVMQIEV